MGRGVERFVAVPRCGAGGRAPARIWRRRRVRRLRVAHRAPRVRGPPRPRCVVLLRAEWMLPSVFPCFRRCGRRARSAPRWRGRRALPRRAVGATRARGPPSLRLLAPCLLPSLPGSRGASARAWRPSGCPPPLSPGFRHETARALGRAALRAVRFCYWGWQSATWRAAACAVLSSRTPAPGPAARPEQESRVCAGPGLARRAASPGSPRGSPRETPLPPQGWRVCICAALGRLRRRRRPAGIDSLSPPVRQSPGQPACPRPPHRCC